MKTIDYPQKNEIIYLEADVNYTIIYLRNGQKMLSSNTLKHHALNEKLHSFLRVHKSYLLNPSFIVGFVRAGNRTEAQLKNGKTIQVSRRKLREVREFINQV